MKNISGILISVLFFVSLFSCQNQEAAQELEELRHQVKVTTEQLEQNKSIVLRAHEEVWSKGNMEVVDEIYASDFVGHWVSGGDTNLNDLKQMVTQSRTTFPDLTEEIVHMVAENDLVVTHFISSGTFKGALNGIEPNGKTGSRPEIAVHRIENGKIAEQWTVADLMSLLNQLEISL